MYADLLDEIGGKANAARARFIRLQIDTHRGPGDTGGTWAFEQKVAEADSLAYQFSLEWRWEVPLWCEPLFSPLGKNPADLFSRGFIERARAKAKILAIRGFELFDVTPIRSLEVLGGANKLLTQMFELPGLTRLKILAIRWRTEGDTLAEVVAGCRLLSNLRELDLSGARLNARGARILSRSEHLPELRVIRLRDSNVNSIAVSSLAASPKLAKLREIDIRGSQLWPETLAILREKFPDKWFRN